MALLLRSWRHVSVDRLNSVNFRFLIPILDFAFVGFGDLDLVCYKGRSCLEWRFVGCSFMTAVFL